MIDYRQRSIKTVREAWRKMRFRGVTMQQASTEDLAVAVLSARYPETRLAAAAELVSRIKDANAARHMLTMVPVRQEHDRPKRTETRQDLLTDSE